MIRRPKPSATGKSSPLSTLPLHGTAPFNKNKGSRKQRIKKGTNNIILISLKTIIVLISSLTCMYYLRLIVSMHKNTSSQTGEQTDSYLGPTSNSVVFQRNDYTRTSTLKSNKNLVDKLPAYTENSIELQSKRTTAEANAYMAAQSSYSVDGEIALKKQLKELYDLQQTTDAENKSPIVTRWLGTSDIHHWISSSKSSQEEIESWKEKVEELKEQMRKKDRELFPWLYDLPYENIPTRDVTETSDTSVKVSDLHNDTKQQIEQGALLSKQFASPAPNGGNVILKPTFGHHRRSVDAIFALAEGYDLRIYLLFINSLKISGFKGDLVISVSAVENLQPGVEDYLRSLQTQEGEDGLNVVAYTVTWVCYEGDGKTIANGAKEGIRNCELVNLYGDETTGTAIKDPRQARPVATARYELYWAWSLQYDKHNWLMLIDSRDTYFQTNPFENLPRATDMNKENGLLYFFEENSVSTKIRDSSFNSRWLKVAYGVANVESLMDKPIICSGSTMGEQVAIEAYLRAMVAQYDSTQCKLKGCDQGFHNYLYYSHSLDGVEGIEQVVTFEQGRGIINNLGVLRSKPLKEWGLLNDEMKVLNWDKSISAVAHQFDRDGELNKHLKGARQKFLNEHFAKK